MTISTLTLLPWVLRYLNFFPKLNQDTNLTFQLIFTIYQETNSAIETLLGVTFYLLANLAKNKNLIRLFVLSAIIQVGSTNKPTKRLKEIPYYAPNPMICGTSTLQDLWKIPRQEPCQIAPIKLDQTPRTTKLMTYKYNFVEYESKAWHCTKIRTQKRVYSRFFRDRFFHEKDTSTQLVTKKECEKMREKRECPLTRNLLKENSWNDDKFHPMRFSPKLTQNDEIWQTNNVIPDFWPYGGHWCCKWYKRTVENCYQYDTHIYKKFGNFEIMSPIGDVSHCNYTAQECQLSDGSYIMWEINPRANCKYLPWKEVTGKRWSNNFMATDNSIGLTFSKSSYFPGCKNETLFMSDQGIPVKIIDNSNWLLGLPDLIPWNEWNTTNMLNSLENLRNKKFPHLPPETIKHRTKRASMKNMRDAYFLTGGQKGSDTHKPKAMPNYLSKNDMKLFLAHLDIIDQMLLVNAFKNGKNLTGNQTLNFSLPKVGPRQKRSINYRQRHGHVPVCVTSDHMAGALQGIWLTMNEHLRFSFEQAMQVTCNNINMMMKLLYTQILENPTLAMRQLFGTEYLVARAGGDMIEIQPCHEIDFRDMKFIPMEKQMCTKDIPVQYKVSQNSSEWHEGYLDPLTKQIKRSSSEIDCELVQMLPLQIGSTYFVYNANRTGLREVPALPEIMMFTTNSTIKFQIEPHIIRHLKMYPQSDFQSAFTMNQLLRAAKPMHQIWGHHGIRPRNYNNTLTLSGHGPRGLQIYPMANMKYSSPFSRQLGNLTDYSYQIWVFLVALYVTCGCIISCCFPEGFGARINMRTLTSRIKEIYEARKQRLERQELDQASVQANEFMDLAHRTLLTPENVIVPGTEAPYAEIARVRFSPNPEVSPTRLAQEINNLETILDLPEIDEIPINAIESNMLESNRRTSIFSRNPCFGTSHESLPFEPNFQPRIAIVYNTANGEIPPKLSLYIDIQLGVLDSHIPMIWDTAAQVSIFPYSALEELGFAYLMDKIPPSDLSGIDGNTVPVIGRVNLLLRFNNYHVELKSPPLKPKPSVRVPHYFMVTDCEIITDAILGLDFAALFTSHEVDLANGQITFTWDHVAPRKEGHTVHLNGAPCATILRPDGADTQGYPLRKLTLFVKISEIEKDVKKPLPMANIIRLMKKLSTNIHDPTTSPADLASQETKNEIDFERFKLNEIEAQMTPDLLSQVARGKHLISKGFRKPTMELTGDQFIQLINILYKHRDLYANLKFRDPRSTVYQSELRSEAPKEIPNLVPECSQAGLEYRKRDLDGLLKDLGIPQSQDNLWSTPVTPIKNKYGKFRMCAIFDWKKRDLIKKVHSVMDMPKICANLEGGKVMTIMDLRKAYWRHERPKPPPRKPKTSSRVKSPPRTKPLSKKKPLPKRKQTRFEIPGLGAYEYIQAPNVGQTSKAYEAKMDEVLVKLNNKSLSPEYNGSFIIASRSVDEHLLHMDLALARFRKADKIIELNKCDLIARSLTNPAPGACYSRIRMQVN